ncbi:hypothetical protein IKE96_01015 [bacterium]|nr:hypothetical protein [bacterium]
MNAEFSKAKEFPLKEEIEFPNGWKLIITYGFKNDKTSLGTVDKYHGHLRKSILLDEKGNIINQVIEENPHQFY